MYTIMLTLEHTNQKRQNKGIKRLSHCYIKLNSIKALTFDLDDTLYNNKPIIKRAQHKLDQFLLAHFPACAKWQARDWLELKKQIISQDPALAHDTSEARIATLTQGLTLLGYSAAEVHQGVDDAMKCFFYYRSDFSVSNNVLNQLKKWAKNLPLVAISNGNVDIDRIGLSTVFQFCLQPGHGIKMKPASDMFTLAATQLAIEPKHILHVGDNWLADIQGARQADFQAAWLNPAFDGEIQIKGSGLLPHIEITRLDAIDKYLR